MNKKTYILIFVSIAMLILISYKIISPNKDLIESGIPYEKNYFQMYDSYDMHGNISVGEFFKKDSSLDDLIGFNNEIKKVLGSNFLEFKDNHIELIDKYEKDDDLVYGGADYKNQEIKLNFVDRIITPIAAVHLDENMLNRLKLKVIEGVNLDREDFKYNNGKVNILMGYDFRNSYNIGDELKFIFATKTWTGTVVGFIEKDFKADFDYGFYDINKYIIVPFFNIGSDEESIINELSAGEDEVFGANTDFLKFYCLFKNVGIVYMENKGEYEKYRKLVSDISDKYDLKFELLRGY